MTRAGFQLANTTMASAIQPAPAVMPSVHCGTRTSESAAPPSPAQAPPNMMAKIRTRTTLYPKEWAASWLSPTARRIKPPRVYFKNHHTPATNVSAAYTVKSWENSIGPIIGISLIKGRSSLAEAGGLIPT